MGLSSKSRKKKNKRRLLFVVKPSCCHHEPKLTATATNPEDLHTVSRSKGNMGGTSRKAYECRSKKMRWPGESSNLEANVDAVGRGKAGHIVQR